MKSDNTLLYEKNNRIGIITINRPERMNALSIDVFDKLNDIWTTVDNDDELSVLIITGAGDSVFCAGMDLKEQAGLSLRGKDMLHQINDPFMKNMRNVKKPIIAAVNGIASAGGFMLVQNSDLRIASENAKFSIQEAKVGRGSPWAVPLLWMMPLSIVLELTMTGEPLTAERAYNIGFVNKLTKEGDVLNKAIKLAEIIRDNAPLSVMASKKSLYEAMSLGSEKGLENAHEIYEVVYKSEDAIEGPKAFSEKRKPQWKGY